MAEHQISTELLELLPAEQVTPRTRLHIANLLSEMVNAKTEEAGWRIRSELQGMFNCLECQGAISDLQHDSLGEAIWTIWKPIAQKFIVERVGQAKLVS